jgi:hypothetical protein
LEYVTWNKNQAVVPYVEEPTEDDDQQQPHQIIVPTPHQQAQPTYGTIFEPPHILEYEDDIFLLWFPTPRREYDVKV